MLSFERLNRNTLQMCYCDTCTSCTLLLLSSTSLGLLGRIVAPGDSILALASPGVAPTPVPVLLPWRCDGVKLEEAVGGRTPPESFSCEERGTFCLNSFNQSVWVLINASVDTSGLEGWRLREPLPNLEARENAKIRLRRVICYLFALVQRSFGSHQTSISTETTLFDENYICKDINIRDKNLQASEITAL